MITGITEITEIHTKQDMSRWTRAHESSRRITWSVFPGPGGTMIIVEHEEDRATLLRRQSLSADIDVAPEVAAALAAAAPENDALVNATPSNDTLEHGDDLDVSTPSSFLTTFA
ncbi:MAG TPA: hypothetical protein VG142_04775 [Trebonia sp.]|nr:hypothetical protein [Trebonia sp.]